MVTSNEFQIGLVVITKSVYRSVYASIFVLLRLTWTLGGGGRGRDKQA